MDWFENLSPVIQALLACTFTWGVTALGALVVCFFKEMNTKVVCKIQRDPIVQKAEQQKQTVIELDLESNLTKCYQHLAKQIINNED